jgi:hypothetical protein
VTGPLQGVTGPLQGVTGPLHPNHFKLYQGIIIKDPYFINLCIRTQMSIIYLLWGVHILLNMIMGGLKHINNVRAFASKICFKLKEVSLKITNLFMEDIIHIGVMRELMVMVMMVILVMMRTLEMKMRETVVMREVYVMRELVAMREVYVMRIKMAFHQTTVQPFLHTIMIQVLKEGF